MAIPRSICVQAYTAITVVHAAPVVVLVVPVGWGIGAVVGLDCEVLVNQGKLAIRVARKTNGHQKIRVFEGDWSCIEDSFGGSGPIPLDQQPADPIEDHLLIIRRSQENIGVG